MPKYKRKNIIVEANKWLSVSRDNPEVRPYPYYPEVVCGRCGSHMKEHGWINAIEGGYGVCPGDWIVTEPNGEIHAYNPDAFLCLYKPVTSRKINAKT